MFFHVNNIKAYAKTVQDLTEGKQEAGEGDMHEKRDQIVFN